jgi:hypothetical protein
MKIQDIKDIAKKKGVNAGKMKTDLVRAIQEQKGTTLVLLPPLFRYVVR